MKVIAAWLREWGTVIVSSAWALGAIAVLIIGYLVSREKKRPPDEQLSQALESARKRADDKIAAAHARAAVEISVARTKDTHARDQLQSILDEKDEARRGEALIAMAKKLRAEQ